MSIKNNLEFELSVVVKKEGKGKLDIAIVSAGGKYEKEAISKIKFSMGNDLTLYNERGLRKAGRL